MAKVRKDLVGSVIAVNESEQYTHLVAGETIPDGYFIGGHAVEDGDPADQIPPWQAPTAAQPAAPSEGALEKIIASGASPEEIFAAVAERLGVSLPAVPSPSTDSDDVAAKKAAKKAAKAEKTEKAADAAGGTPPAAEDDLVPPPLNGTGSSKDVWRDYATKATKAAGLSIDIPEEATRGDIVDALKSAGVRTE